MAVLGLTEQFLLKRAHEGVPHYRNCLERLENFAEAMSVSDRQQDLFGEGFESDEDDEVLPEDNGATQSSKSCQGRIQYALDTRCHIPRIPGR
jgi:hypothetical protein